MLWYRRKISAKIWNAKISTLTYNKSAFNPQKYISNSSKEMMSYAQAIKQTGQLKFTPVDLGNLKDSWKIEVKSIRNLEITTINYKMRNEQTRYDLKFSKSNPKNNGKWHWFELARKEVGDPNKFFNK